MHPRHSGQTVPAYVSFFLKFLADEVAQCRHYSCDVKEFQARAAPRVDAQASDSRTGIGGWLPTVRPDGSIDVWRSYWLSLETVPTWTDNLANGSVLNKLMTPKFPASAVLMDMAAQLKKSVSRHQYSGLP